MVVSQQAVISLVEVSMVVVSLKVAVSLRAVVVVLVAGIQR